MFCNTVAMRTGTPRIECKDVIFSCEYRSVMGTVIKISAELRAWIDHNLNRGCAPEQLIEGMIAERFEPQIARGLVAAFVQARVAGTCVAGDTLTLEGAAPAYDNPRMAAGNRISAGDRIVTVLLRVARPPIAVLSGVLSASECEQLIALALPRLAPSTVVDPQTGSNLPVAHRSSEGMFFRLRETPFIAALDERLSRIMNSPIEHGEGLQVLRYGPGAQSTPHFDFLIPSNAANQRSLARSGQRIGSLVVYLNDVASGGETVFPEVGLSVCPHRGNGVYFEYCDSRNQLDPRSLHAGAPVIAGEKWALTKWMRQQRFVSE